MDRMQVELSKGQGLTVVVGGRHYDLDVRDTGTLVIKQREGAKSAPTLTGDTSPQIYKAFYYRGEDLPSLEAGGVYLSTRGITVLKNSVIEIGDKQYLVAKEVPEKRALYLVEFNPSTDRTTTYYYTFKDIWRGSSFHI